MELERISATWTIKRHNYSTKMQLALQQQQTSEFGRSIDSHVISTLLHSEGLKRRLTSFRSQFPHPVSARYILTLSRS